MEQISRRGFVTGTVGAVAAGAALSAGAPLTARADATYDDVTLDSSNYPEWDIEHTADPAGDIMCTCVIDTDAEGEWTGVNWSWTKKPAVPTADEVSEEVDCEVLIMGLGSAGCAALTYAAAKGADVVAVTADAFPEAEGAYCAAYNSPLNETYGVTYDHAQLMADYAYWGQGQNNGEVTGTIWDRSGDAIEWLACYSDDVWQHDVGPDAQVSEGIHERTSSTHMVYTWPDPSETQAQLRVYHGFPKFLQAVCEKAEKQGARIYYSTPGKQLIQDASGAVVGAYCMKEDGSYLKVNASKGVVLATGDFHHDPEMCAAFLPIMPADLYSRAPYGHNRGDGIKMAWWCGAQQEKGPFNLGICWPHDFEFKAYTPSRWGIQPFLRVNKAGYRYTNETLATHEWYSTSPLCLADMKQPGHTAYQVCDSKYAQVLGDKDAAIFDDCVARGVICKADTIEELGEQLGLTNVPRFVETVERYNEVCEAGSDVDFGVPAEYLPKTCLTEAPFYGMVRPVYKQWTNGGVFINKYGQVLDTQREPIAGLYAAGNIRSGLTSSHYLWKSFGSNKVNAMCGGMLCVKHLLGTWDTAFLDETDIKPATSSLDHAKADGSAAADK